MNIADYLGGELSLIKLLYLQCLDARFPKLELCVTSAHVQSKTAVIYVM